MNTSRHTIPISIRNAAVEWIARLNATNLSEQQEQAFFAWLAQSPLHQAAYLEAEQLWQRGEVLARVQPHTTTLWSKFAWPALATACALILAIVLVPLINNPVDVLYQTAIGEQKKIQLEDGSTIELNTASRVRVSFSRAQRVVQLEQGEVFFEVTKNSARPFNVFTQNGQVRVVGTRFSVRQLQGDALVRVQEGTVALGAVSNDPDTFVPGSLLNANQQQTLTAAINGESPQVLDTSSALAWRKRMLVFNGQSLAAVIDELQRYFPVVIELENKQLADTQVTAVIRLQDLRTTLSVLEGSLGLRSEYDEANKKVFLRLKTD